METTKEEALASARRELAQLRGEMAVLRAQLTVVVDAARVQAMRPDQSRSRPGPVDPDG